MTDPNTSAVSGLLYCEHCLGKNKLLCEACKGLGVAAERRGKVLYFKYRLSRYDLLYNRIERKFNKIRFFSVLSLGLTCLTWGIYIFYLNGNLTNFFVPAFAQVLFLLGVSFVTYAWYRNTVEKKTFSSVEQFNYDKDEREGASSWDEILKISYRNRINISEAFTEEAELALDRAYEIADAAGESELTPVHVFLALLEHKEIHNTFIRLQVVSKSLAAECMKLIANNGRQKTPPMLGEKFYELVFDAYETAYNLHQSYVSVTELLVSAVKHSKELEDILFDLSVDEQKLFNVVAWTRIHEKLSREFSKLYSAGRLRSKTGMDRAMTAVATPYLNHLSEDVTLKAQFGRLEMCVAREQETDEIFQIIEGGVNNVLLVGDYGVGKRTIIGGIAEKMVEGDVPKRLYDKRLVQISPSSLLSGTTPTGGIERLATCLNETSRAGNVILFIHNIHELLGVSAGLEDNSLDVAGTLVEYLSGGSFLVIATTTTEAFSKLVNNSKLSTVFTKVEIKEMDDNQAIEALESKAALIEYKEKIYFAYDSLQKAVEYARKFLRESPLPHSAIELMTEAAVYTRRKKGEKTLVGAEEIGAVLADKKHIPLTAVSGDEASKLMRLEEEMHKRVVGQDEAVRLVANALRRARAEVRSHNRPIANFLFLGPTGVGKTELAKTIAEVYFGGEERMIRLDMSEYQDTRSVYRLIGEPNEKGSGILTEAVRRQPFALLLLDEIEKADKDVLNLFLQVMDDGRLTDSTGRTVDFTNVIMLATSNAGTSYVQEKMREGMTSEIIKEHLLHGELKDYFRPEFLNRFDGIVLFDPLSGDAIKKITTLLLQRIGKDLEARGIKLKISDEAVEYFSMLGYDPEFGARPLRRVLQEKVENELAELLLTGDLKRRATVVVGEEGKISVE